jgi:hypothetical protein
VGGGEDIASIGADMNRWSTPMQKLNDLSRSLIPLEPDGTLIAVIEMSLSSWLVAGIVPGVERQPLKKLEAETFMLLDAGFLKAALALEDWRAGSMLVRDTPYDVTRLHFFDTTHLDRASTPWRFDDPERTPAAQASRMATDFAASKGFGAGGLTGHHIGERVRVLCLPVPGTTFIDILDSEIAALPFPFDDINTTPWAQVGRAAMEIAGRRGAGAGFFTGHQVPGRKGWIGIDARLVEVFDIDDGTVASSQWAFTDINTVGWAQAARLASDVCFQRGFAGGFFTGHQLPNKRQIAALRHT